MKRRNKGSEDVGDSRFTRFNDNVDHSSLSILGMFLFSHLVCCSV